MSRTTGQLQGTDDSAFSIALDPIATGFSMFPLRRILYEFLKAQTGWMDDRENVDSGVIMITINDISNHVIIVQ